ncbi:MAG: phosphoribosylanthranilate isomerase [Desulfovibrionales bacterium]
MTARPKPAIPAGCIQVAGIRDAGEAELLLRCGVQWLGFPFGLPVHAEDTSRDEAARIIAGLPERAVPILITYLDRAHSITALARRLGVRGVQLHGKDVSVDEIQALRSSCPDLLIVRSLVVRVDNASLLLQEVEDAAGYVDGFLTDTYDPESGAEGATGRVHDWSISRALVEKSPLPVILAGGLTPENVEQAIARVRPWGVDVHTGLEGPDGRKDADLVGRFVNNANTGFSRTSPWPWGTA